MEWTPQSAEQKLIQSVNPLSELYMNDQDIEQFIKAFDDFMQHAETEIDSHQKWKEAERYKDEFYERKAAELEVTVDYYLEEFVQ